MQLDIKTIKPNCFLKVHLKAVNLYRISKFQRNFRYHPLSLSSFFPPSLGNSNTFQCSLRILNF